MIVNLILSDVLLNSSKLFCSFVNPKNHFCGIKEQNLPGRSTSQFVQRESVSRIRPFIKHTTNDTITFNNYLDPFELYHICTKIDFK